VKDTSVGATRKTLNCGGLNVGGGNSTVAEGPTPGGAETMMNISGSAISGRSSAQTGSNRNCSNTGCQFGPFLSIASAGTSTCVRNTFSAPASGTLNTATGDFNGSFPLTSEVFLTANASAPCPKCVAGACQAGWTSGVGPSPTEGDPCTATDGSGSTYDCEPPPAAALPSFPVNLTPITTGTASDTGAAGIFCPGQTGAGAFGCSGSGAANAICPGGNVPPVPNYIEEIGDPNGPVTSSPTASTIVSVFCIPSVGGSLGFLINGAANLPGPGATSLPGTLAILGP
jgi:hypothetical protein